MLYGYGGHVLRLNLSDRSVKIEPLSEELVRDYVGGRGFVAKVLYDEVPRGADPLGEENVVAIAPGPLSGTFLPCPNKVAFGAKSPATGGYGDSIMGGHFAAELKHAGFDLVVIKGRSEEPCVIVIDDDEVRIEDGKKYWGKGSMQTEKMLKEDLGEDFQIATIGPAGEKMVYFACITHDFGRQAGRTGVGAVLGSKNIKAIAVRGSKGFPIYDPEGVIKKGQEMYDAVFAKPGFEKWTPYGTADIVNWVNEVGSFPTKNFWTGYYEEYKKINGVALRESVWTLDKGCFACPIPCGKYSKATFRGKEVRVEGPEYETIALVGSNCLIDDIEEVAYANYVLDELGLDTISGGNVIAFALECIEKGIITKDQVEGKDLKFGDLESFVWLAEKIAAREGIGDLLAQGVKTAAAKLGQGSEKFAIHVKGLEVSGYEPRYAPATLLAYMTCDVGAHHNRAWAITYDVAVGREKKEGKAAKVIELQHVRPLLDCLGICRFPWIEIGFELDWYAEIWPLVTGQDKTWEDLLKDSERIWNLTRAFSAREIEGFGIDYDQPPARFYEEDVPTGPIAGNRITKETLDALLKEYYELRGWNEKGLPTAEKLRELKLDFVVEDLY